MAGPFAKALLHMQAKAAHQSREDAFSTCWCRFKIESFLQGAQTMVEIP